MIRQTLSNWLHKLKYLLIMKAESIVEMLDSYPFGQQRQASSSDGQVWVLKKLTYKSPDQLDMIKRMVGLLEGLKNEYLIELVSYELAGEQLFHFYYEYVPLTLQKWILDLGDDILDDLQGQMLSLAQYLTENNIKFSFNPSCLGLSKDIRVKYFLYEFMVDDTDQKQYCEEIAGDIRAYFRQFKQTYDSNDETQTDFTSRKSADSVFLSRMGVQTQRGSWEAGRTKSIISEKKIKNQILLSQKVQNSKKKSMEILMKLKSLKSTKSEKSQD